MTNEIGKGKTRGRAKLIVRWICSLLQKLAASPCHFQGFSPQRLGEMGELGGKAVLFSIPR